MNTAYQNRNFHGSQCPGRKSWTITDKLLEAQSLGGPGVQGWGPPLLCFTSRGSTRFSQQISEKNPLLIATEDKKRNHFEKCQNTLFFLGRSAFKGNYLTRVKVLFFNLRAQYLRMKLYQFPTIFSRIQKKRGFFLIHTLRLASLSYPNQTETSQGKETTGQRPHEQRCRNPQHNTNELSLARYAENHTP